MRKALLVDIICSFFILLFLYTAFSKLLDYTSFRLVLSKSPLLQTAAPIVAWLLPVVEIGISTLLFFPPPRLAGLYGTLIALLLFTGYLSYMIAVSPHLPCSCGGVLKQLTWQQHLVFNGACIGIAITGILLLHSLRRQKIPTPNIPPRPSA